MNRKAADWRADIGSCVRAVPARCARRRAVLIAAAAWPAISFVRVACAQALPKLRRIGLLSPFSPSDRTPWHEAFRLGLRDLGWVEGSNINIEYRYAEGKSDRLPALAEDLVARKIELIVAAAGPEAVAAQKATRLIPIVVVAPSDPVAIGLVESLARPGGNVTGLSQMSPQLTGKRLELLKELIPRLTRVAVLWNPHRGAASTVVWKELELPARRLGIELQSLEVQSPDDFDKAFENAAKARVGALFVIARPLIGTNLKKIAELAAKNRLPSIYVGSEFADAGGLVTYGPDRAAMFRRAATFVDKILRGAKPGDLPMEQPTKFELVINMKTAKVIGLTIPQDLLLRADKVIE